MVSDDNKPYTIAIQDPLEPIHYILARSTTPQEAKFHMVEREREEILNGSSAFLVNKPLTDRLRYEHPFLSELSLKLASDGYGYLAGAFIRTQPVFTPKDIETLPDLFPFADVENTQFALVTEYATPFLLPNNSFVYSKYIQKRREEGYSELRIGINTDVQGRLLFEEHYEVSVQVNGLFGRKRVVNKKESKSRLVTLDSAQEEHVTLVRGLVKVCQLVQSGINTLHQYTGQTSTKPITYFVAPDTGWSSMYGDSQMIFSVRDRAESYTVFDIDGTSVILHYSDSEEGNIKVSEDLVNNKKTQQQSTRVKLKVPKKTQEEPQQKPTPPAVISTEQPITLDDVIGAEEAKRELRGAINHFRNPEQSRLWGIPQKAGVLLYGPPGTGKTLLAKAVAHEAGAQILLYKSENILSKWSGQSEENLGELLNEAKKYERSILLIDEFDALARSRQLTDGSSHGTEGRLVTIMLSFLDGFEQQDNVYLMGTTNRKNIIDDAILQRLNAIEVPLPNEAARAEMVRRRIEKHKSVASINPFGDLDYQAIASASTGLSGRELVGEKQGVFLSLLQRAKETTEQQGELYVINTNDWLEEIARIKPAPPKPMGFT